MDGRGPRKVVHQMTTDAAESRSARRRAAENRPAETRRRVLAALRASQAPMTIEQLSEELVVHPNTVRFHTATLEHDGLIVAGKQPTGGKGRPRTVYSTTPAGARAGSRNFELVSTVLLAQLGATAEDPMAAARAAGRAWGAARASRAGGLRSSTRVLLDVLDDIGFEPRPVPSRRPTEIRLYNCPFRELVDDHQELVCSLHAGLVDGLASEHPDASRVELIPTPAESSCVVRLLNGDGGPQSSS